MRKVIVSGLVLSLCLGLGDGAFAKKKKSTRSSKRATSSSELRASRSSTSSSSSSSSSSGSSIQTSTHRFIADSAVFDTKLRYDVKYDLATMLLPSVSAYYKSNGSAGLNETLCFGPYMKLTGISSSGDIVSYSAEAGFECQPLLAGYSYTIELVEASKSQLETFALSRRLKIVRSDVDVNYMSFDYEQFVDVAEFVPKIVSAINDAKSSCSAFYDDMEKLKGQLGWSTGLSVGGMLLSGGATAVGVVNVKKTNEVGKKIEQYNKITDVSGEEDKSTKDDCKSSIDLSLVESTKLDESKLATEKLGCVLRAKEELESKIAEKKKDLGVNLNDKEVEKKVNEKTFDFLKFEGEMGGVKWSNDGSKITECKKYTKLDNNKKPEFVDDKIAGSCKARIQSYGLSYDSKDKFDKSYEKRYAELKNEADNISVEIWSDARNNPSNYVSDTGLTNMTDSLVLLENRIKKIEENNSKISQRKSIEKSVDSNVKTSHTLDWVQAGLNAGSLLTSGGTFALSLAAVATADSALSHLQECESKMSALKLLYNSYNAELESYGEE
ncbi:MAG: hypothetical protein K6F04_03400 [bacterium]|nr:hypothetical protein [bacterium]